MFVAQPEEGQQYEREGILVGCFFFKRQSVRSMDDQL